MGAFSDAATSFGLTALSETGDKSQLLLIALAARWRRAPVAVGGVVGIAGVQLVAVAIGGWLAATLEDNERLPDILAAVIGAGFTIAGLSTLVFALRASRASDGDAEHGSMLVEDGRGSQRGQRSWAATAFSTAGLLFVAELGDKTMFATAALSAVRSPVAVFVGATAAFAVLATGAVLVGGAIADRLPERALQIGAGIAFVVAGVATLASSIG